jgi:hypothetical protein
MLQGIYNYLQFRFLRFKVIDRFLKFAQEDDLGQLSFAELVLYWSIVLTPLWWLLGIQTLYFPAIAASLLALSFRLDKFINIPLPVCILSWLGMGLTMIWTASLGLSDVNFAPFKVVSTAVTFFKGYFLIFSCLALPFWSPIRLKVIVRAVAWMAVGYGVAAILQVILLVAGIWDQSYAPPLARLIPGDKLSLLLKPAAFKPFFGITLPRTSLYMADPPIPGICGLLSYFICKGEANRRLRYLSIAGCMIALFISQSRLAWVCFPMAVLLTASFRHRLARIGSLWGACGIFAFCAALGLTLVDLLNMALGVFTEARASSSADRSLVVSMTLEAWQARPWFGWGIVGGTVKWYIYDIVLGSFSTYAGVLYLHGVLGFVCLINALVSTLWKFWSLSIQGNPLAQGALSSFLALCLFVEGLPLSWMCIYFWFYFIWLGCILAQNQKLTQRVLSWEHLL